MGKSLQNKIIVDQHPESDAEEDDTQDAGLQSRLQFSMSQIACREMVGLEMSSSISTVQCTVVCLFEPHIVCVSFPVFKLTEGKSY